jgi:hypothetical protein
MCTSYCIGFVAFAYAPAIKNEQNCFFHAAKVMIEKALL